MVYAPGGRLRAAWRLALYLLALAAGMLISQGLLRALSGTPLDAHVTLDVLGAWASLLGAVVAHFVMLRGVERRPWGDVGLGRAQLTPRALSRRAPR